MAFGNDTANGGGFAPPNHTQTPNEFYDEVLPQITAMSELKVTLAIIRKTFGWHKDEDKLSLSQLTNLTGLTRRSVAEGVALAMKRGYVGRRKDGQGYIYGLRVRYEKSSYEPATSEDTTPVTSEGIIPTKERVKERNASTAVDAAETATKTDEEPEGWHFEEYIREGLNEKGLPYTRPIVRRYTRQANSLLKRGEDPETIYEGCDRVISEWERVRLTLDDAIRDVGNGTTQGIPTSSNGAKPQDISGGTPAQAIDYVFANAAGEYFKNNESRIRRAMQQHDFTGYESPSYPIQKMLGGTDQEIWQVMDGLESLLRRWHRKVKDES